MGLRGCLFVECECDVVFQGGYGERIGLRAACLRLYFDDHVAAGLGSQVGGWGAVTEQLRELGITVHFQPVGGVATV